MAARHFSNRCLPLRNHLARSNHINQASSNQALSASSSLAHNLLRPITHRDSNLPHIRTMATDGPLHVLNYDNINPRIKTAKYAVRGELPARAEKYTRQIAKGDTQSLPFKTVIPANIGNPQQLDQKPITFFRQVASLLENPQLLAALEGNEGIRKQLGYENDVITRAKTLLGFVKSVGAYSESAGARGIRESVAKFIERRDGYGTDVDNIWLTNGASSGVNTLMNIMCSTPNTGVLVPIPQYPLYTATLAVLQAQCVPYYLDESQGWGTSFGEIESALKNARANGTDVKAIVVINAGNPTGAKLSSEDVKGVLDLARREKLVVMADEVYQTNIFEGEFYSFKKGLRDLQKEQPGKFDNIELASLHSVSKGMVGECGHRGGYFELDGFDPAVKAEIQKFVSISLCPPVLGQCIVEMMVNPPKEGEPSYPLYREEYDGVYAGLKKRAFALYDAFKEMEGVDCQYPTGSMYLFPTITIPSKAVQAAEKEARKPDEYYCSRLLDATGVCVVPGSGFGQRDGTLHFRTTFLAPGTDWVGRITKFHKDFMSEFR